MANTVTQTSKPKAADKAISPDPFAEFGFAPLSRLRNEFDTLWNKFFTDMPALWNAERNDLRWSFDIEDLADEYVVKAEAPGFELKDFNIELRGDQLVLQAKKSDVKHDKDDDTFTSTEFYRAMTIPAYIAKDKIDATYRDGVLTVNLPKTDEAKAQKIEVKA